MTKFCINITSSPLKGALEDDNLRGEGRWERLVARGLLSTGEPVGTPQPKWAGDAVNWVGHIEDISECAYVAIYGGPEQPVAHTYLFQFFSAPNARIEGEIRDLMRRVGHRRVFLTQSYPSAQTYARLAEDLLDRTAWLPMPVPDPTDGDHTQNTVLFFPARNIADSIKADNGEVLRFVRRALEKDERLTFECLSACNDPSEDLWAMPAFSSTLGHLRHRVAVHCGIEHRQVQEIYARSRLVVCPAGYGGPPLESARVGLPVIALERDCSLYSAPYTPAFWELPRLGDKRRLVDILDHLLYDPGYSRRVGDACRRYVAEKFSCTAYRQALRAVLERA